MLSGEATHDNVIVFGWNRSGPELERSTLTITPLMRFKHDVIIESIVKTTVILFYMRELKVDHLIICSQNVLRGHLLFGAKKKWSLKTGDILKYVQYIIHCLRQDETKVTV